MATRVMQELLEFSFSDQLVQMIPQIPTVLSGVFLVLVVMAIKVLIAPYGVPCHLIWPFEEWLILNLFKNLMHWLLEHNIDRLSISRPWLPSKISPRPVVIVSVWPDIPPLPKDNLSLSFPLLLVFLNPFIFIDPIHELAHTGDRFASQGFP